MAGLTTTQIESEARSKLKEVGKSRPIQTQKLAKAELKPVQDQLGGTYSVEVSGEHELTITLLSMS